MRLVLASLAALATFLAGGLAAVAQSPSPASAAALHHTVKVVVRPVHRNGTPVAGWTVHRERIPGFTCTDGSSTVAVDPGIRFCGFSATDTVACWKSTHHTALCLRDPRVHKLARIRYSGTFRKVAAPAHPSPQALALFKGGYCVIRDGGAWGSVKGHPHWYGAYGCSHSGAIYGSGRDGIDRSVNPWRVHLVLNPKGTKIRNHRVATAYYVGTAL